MKKYEISEKWYVVCDSNNETFFTEYYEEATADQACSDLRRNGIDAYVTDVHPNSDANIIYDGD